MQPVDETVPSYDTTTIWLHWLTAFLVVEQWVGAQIIDWFPRGALRVDARSVHIVLGFGLVVVLVVRLWWRAGRGRRLAPADHGFLQLIATATHWVLYGLLVAIVVLGVLLALARADSIFNLFTLPALGGGDRALRGSLQYLHGTLANIVLIVAGLHAAAALAHRFLWRDGVLARMLPIGR